MRWLALAGILALLATNTDRLRSEYEAWTGETTDPRVQAAIELRCANDPVSLRDACAQDLQRDFQEDVREPEAIVRRHCTRFSSEWTLDLEEPSTICRDLYGGWIEG